MGWSIFIEESGVHQKSLPYGALVGVAVEDRFVWQLARKLRDAEVHFFGSRLERLSSYITVDTILGAELVKVASLSPGLPPPQRATLTRQYLSCGNVRPPVEQVVAFAQTQVAFCSFALGILRDFEAKSFAILTPSSEVGVIHGDHIRKDYAFLFERVSRFLATQTSSNIGTLVLDPQRHLEDFVPISTITSYFEKTTKGRLRSRFIIPEPLMANSSLRVINQVAVIISRVLSWGFRLPGMTHPRRFDLDELVRQCNQLRILLGEGSGRKEWSFIFVEDIRPRHETASSPRFS